MNNFNEDQKKLLAVLRSMNGDDMPRSGSILRAPFPWPGSKAQSAKYILPHLPHRFGYVEPFGGSGAILLQRRACKLEVLNDRYSGITTFFQCVRDKEKLDLLLKRLEYLIHSREDFETAKTLLKNTNYGDPVERAALWYQMVSMSVSGKGKYFGRATTAAGQHGNSINNNLDLLRPLHNRLKNVQVENLDWRVCLSDFDAENVVLYLDPPWLDVENEKDIYHSKEFTIEHHRELLERIFQLKGFVALSGRKNDLYSKYKWDEVHSFEIISTMPDSKDLENIGPRKKITEYLWIKH